MSVYELLAKKLMGDGAPNALQSYGRSVSAVQAPVQQGGGFLNNFLTAATPGLIGGVAQYMGNSQARDEKAQLGAVLANMPTDPSERIKYLKAQGLPEYAMAAQAEMDTLAQEKEKQKALYAREDQKLERQYTREDTRAKEAQKAATQQVILKSIASAKDPAARAALVAGLQDGNVNIPAIANKLATAGGEQQPQGGMAEEITAETLSTMSDAQIAGRLKQQYVAQGFSDKEAEKEATKVLKEYREDFASVQEGLPLIRDAKATFDSLLERDPETGKLKRNFPAFGNTTSANVRNFIANNAPVGFSDTQNVKGEIERARGMLKKRIRALAGGTGPFTDADAENAMAAYPGLQNTDLQSFQAAVQALEGDIERMQKRPTEKLMRALGAGGGTTPGAAPKATREAAVLDNLPQPQQTKPYVAKIAAKFEELTGTPLPEKMDNPSAELMQSLRFAESSNGKNLVGPVIKSGANKGDQALGPYQLTNKTGREWHSKLKIEEPYNPKDEDQSFKIASAYMDWQLDRFDGNPRLALAAYNAGHRSVENAITKTARKLESTPQQTPIGVETGKTVMYQGKPYEVTAGGLKPVRKS